MKNKNLVFKVSMMAFAIGCFGLSFTSATSFQLKIEKLNAYGAKMAQSIVPVHFVDNGNDFGGFIYFSNGGNIAEKDDCNRVGGDKSGDRYDGTCEGTEEAIKDERDYCPYGDRSGDEDGDREGDGYDGICEGPNEPLPDEDGKTSGDIYEVSVVEGTPEYECKTRVKGFYYNAERGERLRPLDTETWATIEEGFGLTTEGGFYTQCRRAGYEAEYRKCEALGDESEESGESGESGEPTEPETPEEIFDMEACAKQVDIDYPSNDGYFGQLKQVYSGQTFGLVMGTNYEKNDGVWYSVKKDSNDNIELGETFVRFNKQIPLGFIYDYNGGLGFAGCEIKASNKVGTLEYLLSYGKYFVSLFVPNGNGKIAYQGQGGSNAVDCENIGTAADSLIKLIIEGLVGMNRESNLGVIGNQTDSKMQYFSSSDINSATLLNYVKQRSEILCRGKWQNNMDSYTSKFSDSKVVCLDLPETSTVGSDISKWTKDNGKTLVVKNANVVIDPVNNLDNDLGNYDIFINGGDLYINETGGTMKYVFTTQGFIADKTIGEFQEAVGVIESDGEYTGGLSGVGSFIKGNFVVDGKVKGTTQNEKLNNKYFIHGKFTTRDSFADLEDTFVWRCSDGYVVNKQGRILNDQGRFCPPSINGYHNPYESASLVVIDQNYDSPLYW